MAEPGELMCYARPTGRVGVRNHVVALATDPAARTLSRAIARRVTGVLPLWLDSKGGAGDAVGSLALDVGLSPNIAAAIVIGLDRSSVATVAGGLATEGTPVEGFAVEGPGYAPTVAAAARAAARLSQDASELERQPIPRGALVLSTVGARESEAAPDRVIEWIAARHRAAGGKVIARDRSDEEDEASIVAAGAVVELRAAVAGEAAAHPICPTLTFADGSDAGKAEHPVDFDLARLPQSGSGLEEAGARALEELDAMIEGRLTWGEALGPPEPAILTA